METSKLITKKVITVKKDASIQDAAKLMRKHHIGDVVVIDPKNNAPIGILTDRDIVLATIALNIPYEGMSVADIMSERLVTVSESADVHEVIRLMKQFGVKRIPVVGAKKALVGIISRENVLKYLGDEFSSIGETYLSQKLKEKERRPQLQ